MSVRTVRLDQNTEKALATIVRKTNLSISGAIKKGLLVFYDKLQHKQQNTAFEIYSQINLGEGDTNIPASTNTRQAVLEVLKRKHKK